MPGRGLFHRAFAPNRAPTLLLQLARARHLSTTSSNMAPNPKDARVTSVDPMVTPPYWCLIHFPHSTIADPLVLKPPDEARWIRLNKITYTDPIGRSRTWESAERQVGTYYPSPPSSLLKPFLTSLPHTRRPAPPAPKSTASASSPSSPTPQALNSCYRNNSARPSTPSPSKSPRGSSTPTKHPLNAPSVNSKRKPDTSAPSPPQKQTQRQTPRSPSSCTTTPASATQIPRW
jgi:hypothetical protein